MMQRKFDIRAPGEPPGDQDTGSRYWMPPEDGRTWPTSWQNLAQDWWLHPYDDDCHADEAASHAEHFIIDYMTHLGTTLQEAEYGLGFRV